MCGIAGKFHFDAQNLVKTEGVREMTKKLGHRGPDDSGVWCDANIGLGHTRLAVIDTSTRGHQPMSDEDQSVVITYNGEVYNYKELRAELARDGVRFRSDTDTEVLLYLYKKYGVACLARLRGMFAFAIWDKERRQLFCARDRLGQKPFKYYCDSGRFLFASEAKALFADSSIPKEVDWSAVDEYLTYHYVPAPKTGFKNIYKLEPAHYLLVSEDGTITKERYWHIDYAETDIDKTEREWKHTLSETLHESVRLRLISDVPLGVHLSGGVDSSLVAALAAEASPTPIQTFTIAFDEKTHDEREHAQAVARHIGSDHHELTTHPEALAVLPELAYHYEEPYADPSAIPTWYLGAMTRKAVTVALNGDGGDENFAGYNRYRAMEVFARIRPVAHLLPSDFLVAVSRRLWGMTGNPVFRDAWHAFEAGKTDLARFYLSIIGVFSQDEKERLYGNEHREKVGESRWYTALNDRLVENARAPLTHRLLYADIHTYLPDNLLVKTDIASMAHGLETRSPFLDHIFMEQTARMPANLKLRGSETKYLLKQIAKDYIPNEVIERPKQGFGVPLRQWFRTSLAPYLYETLLDPTFTDYGFNRTYIKSLIEEHENGQAVHTDKLWTLLMLRHWFAVWFNK